MTREEAKAMGSKFFDGSRCIRSHSGTRYVTNNNCIQCESERGSGELPPEKPSPYMVALRLSYV